MNIIEGLHQELNRNRELLDAYLEIPTGGFGAMVIQQKIDRAEKAIANGDTTEMLRCYQDLKDSQ